MHRIWFRTMIATTFVLFAAMAETGRGNDDWLDTDELAALFKVPAWTVRKWRANGTGPRGTKLGRHVRYLRSEALRWAESHSDPAA